jgi:hypothetical protein
MALATLSIDFIAKLANLEAGMDKAGRLAEKQAAQIEARYARLTSVATQFGAAIGGAVSVAGLAQFFRATVNGLDALNDLKDATGASIENISALEDIAARTGTSFDTVGTALIRMNRLLNDAKPGNEAAAMFEAVGLSVEELKRLDPAEAWRRFAVALNGFADDGAKARLVGDQLGKTYRELAQLIKDTAEAGALNPTVTTEQAEQAERLNKEFSALAKSATDFARALVGPVVEGLNTAIERFRLLRSEGASVLDFITDRYRVSNGADPLALDKSRIDSLKRELQLLDARLASGVGMDQLKNKLLADRVGLVGRIATAELRLSEADPRNDPRAGRGFSAVKPSVPELPDKPEKPPVVRPGRASRGAGTTDKAFVGDLLNSAQVAALRTLEQTDIARITALRQELEALLKMQLPGDETKIAQAIADVNAKIQAIDPAARAAAESMARINAALSNTPAARLADARRLVDELQTELARTSDPERGRQINQAIGQLYESIDALPTVAEPAFAELDSYAQRFSQNIQDAFGDTLTATLDGNFKGIITLWKNMLMRMVAEAAAADLARALFPQAGGSEKTSSLAALVTTAIKIFGGGGSSGNLDAVSTRGGRALGGGVHAGGIYPVNEKGWPELLTLGNRQLLLMGKQGGQVTPLSPAAGGGGGVTVQVINNGRQAEVESSSQEQTATGPLVKLVLREVAADIRRGGVVGTAGGATWGLNRAIGAPRRG